MSTPMFDPREAAVRFSLLKLIGQSPLHYYNAIQEGHKEPTLSMRLGSGGHAVLFGTPRIVVYRGGEFTPEGAKKPKTYSDVRSGACWEDFKARHSDCLILNENEIRKAEAMARAISQHPDADRLLFAQGTQHEIRHEWMQGGRRCAGTFDAIGPTALLDLKCVQDASPRRFPWQAKRMAYHAQLAWYVDGAELAGLGERVPYIVAVENGPPYSVQVYALTADDLEDGRALYNEWLDVVLECEESGVWPSYSSEILPLNTRGLPPPAEPDEEAEDEEAEDEEADPYESTEGEAA